MDLRIVLTYNIVKYGLVVKINFKISTTENYTNQSFDNWNVTEWHKKVPVNITVLKNSNILINFSNLVRISKIISIF